MTKTRNLRLLAYLLSLSFAACGGGNGRPDGGDPDGGVDGAIDGMVPDGGDGGTDAGDGGTDGGIPGCGMGPATGPTITVCPGDALPSLAEGTCEMTAGDGNTLITGDVLTPGEVFRGGQVLVGTDGAIACVGCDCSGEAAASGATLVVCPDGVVSPGLINAHDHITFDRAPPFSATPERYEHRHDWRGPVRGHTKISSEGFSSNVHMQWHELRQILSGTTSVIGSGGPEGFLRNLDSNRQEGLGQPQVRYETFPLGDGRDEDLLDGTCGYPSIDTASEIAREDAYAPHVAEGIDREARNEFLCMREGANDLVQPNSAFIHGIGLLPPDIGEMANDGTSLIWSPRTNIALYGDTARVTEYSRLGVSIALGTDWALTGSMNMVRELRCAMDLNDRHMAGFFTDEQLWLMATQGSAQALAVDDVLGVLSVGRVADIAIYDGSMRADHRAILEAQPEDIVLVLRGGEVMFGDDALVPGLPGGGTCDALDVCGTQKQVCVMGDLGKSFSTLSGENSDRYALFFCGVPDNEPSCVPERNAPDGFPNPEVTGSNRYTGDMDGADMDGDGIDDVDDNCVCTFNPIRPLDEGMQGDFDGDGVGDACDICPLNADTSVCSPPDPDDRDGDGVANAMDNCPEDPNDGQEDADMDDKGDVCDSCPDDANPGSAACPGSIYGMKTGVFSVGESISITGAIVTGVGGNGYFLQVDPADAAYTGPDNSGTFVFTGGAPMVSVGDVVDLPTASVNEFRGQLQLTGATPMVTGTATVPAPIAVTAAEVVTGGSRAVTLESVLVQVTSVTVSSIAPPPGMSDTAPTGEFAVEDMLRIDDFMFLLSPFPTVGESFASITGVLAFRNGNTKIEPRSIDDIVGGPAALASLGPALSFAREGAGAAPTFPEALMVRLTRPATAPTVITMSAGTGATVTDVTVPAGEISAVVPVTGVTASITPVSITATLDGFMISSDVRVLGAAELPRLTDLSPSSATLLLDGAADFTVTLDVPAPAGGTTVNLSIDAGGTLPASVTVPADSTTATFSFTAGSAVATGTITASLNADMFTSAIDVIDAAPGELVINEVDYDSIGTDNLEFLELYNGGGVPVDLGPLQLVFVTGSTSTVYNTIDLTGSLAAGAYLVVANTGVTVPASATRIDIPSNGIQNGAPDAIALYNTVTMMVEDAISYEGSITAATLPSGSFNLVEGTATTAEDNNATIASIARIPNGADTDDAATDWATTTSPTPGAANTP